MNVMKESKPSTNFTLKGPQISVWIISKTPVLRFAPFLIFFAYFPLMQSMQYSTFASEKFKGWRIFSLMRPSILPLEIWPKRQCHNFEEVSLLLYFRLVLMFVFEEEST